MVDVERAGAFYLGKEYDLESGQVLDKPVMYDARDLTTHAVCLGMTGSGKTGLCIDLLEEATLDGVPSIIIDPKGDVTNLLLTFPDLLPEDFEPWIKPRPGPMVWPSGSRGRSAYGACETPLSS